MGSCPVLFCSRRLKWRPTTALYMTRERRKTCSISLLVGTRPSSDWRATAILALRSLLFCSALVGTLWEGIVIVTIIVSKLTEPVKYCDIDFVMGFVTSLYAQLPRISGVLGHVPKRVVFVTALVETRGIIFSRSLPLLRLDERYGLRVVLFPNSF